MRTHNSFVIALCGPDGTGKSTHASLIARTLMKNGYVTKRIWIKNVHLLSFLIVAVLERIDRKHVLRSTSGAILTSSIANYAIIWTWIETSSIILRIIPYVFLKNLYKLFKRKMVLVADRFILDSMVHILISVILSKFGFKNKKQILTKILLSYPYRVLFYISTKFSTIILLDGEEEILVERKKRSKKHDPYWYITLQRLLYHIITKALMTHVYYINTSNKSIKETYFEILKLIGENTSYE